MSKSHAAVFFSLVIVVFVATPSNAQPSDHGVDVEKLLDSFPISLDIPSSIHVGYQSMISIPLNLERIYGAMCILELPFLGIDRQGPYPSLEMDYVPLAVNEETTLRQFLETTCSDGKLAWAVIHNAIHIGPAEETQEKENYLDSVRISLDLSGVSMLDAGKAWALTLNTNRKPGSHGVGISHSFALADTKGNRVTPPSLTAPGSVTLKVENVTAREALCAILGASPQVNWIYYHHHQPTRYDSVTLHATQAEISSCALITPEERQALTAQEDLESVLVEPAMVGEQR